LGFEHLAGRGYDWIIIMDSDGQHSPEEIPLFIKKAEEEYCGIINGSRLKKPDGMPLIRLITNRFMSFVVSMMAGQSVEDCQCGYKMISKDVLNDINLKCDHFEIEDELILEASRCGYKIANLAIRSKYGHELSHIHPLRDTIRFFEFITLRLLKSPERNKINRNVKKT
jgi:glycosyltransferase involved in cell wall biosynthesis